jgi:pimeloyl-ACP methyl ester carboxylesterase
MVGASIGSDVLTGFAAAYPDRVNRLVYLDEASDQSELPNLEKFGIVPPGLMVQPSRAAFRTGYWRLIEGASTWTAALEADMHFGQAVGPSGVIEPQLSDPLATQFIKGKAIPEHRRIRAKVLAIFSHGYVWETVAPENRNAVRDVWNADRDRHAERFRTLVPQAEVVVLEGAAHPLLIHRAADVLRLAKAFLLR